MQISREALEEAGLFKLIRLNESLKQATKECEEMKSRIDFFSFSLAIKLPKILNRREDSYSFVVNDEGISYYVTVDGVKVEIERVNIIDLHDEEEIVDGSEH